MPLIVKNRNKHIYNFKIWLRRCLHRNLFLLKAYLKLKEFIIRRDNTLKDRDPLFRKIFIETISYCNNDCEFCPASTKLRQKNPKHFMKEELFLKILNELESASFKGSVAFHCNNEPLLDSRLVSWVKMARLALKNNFFYLYTNGILINFDLANQLFVSGINRIIINNYSNQHELIACVKDLFDRHFFLKGEVIVQYRSKAEYRGNRAGQSPNVINFLREPLKAVCLRPSQEIVVGYDGTVVLCCADGLGKQVMGNVRDSNLRDIWFSDSFMGKRKSLLEQDRNCAQICRTCDALDFSAAKGLL